MTSVESESLRQELRAMHERDQEMRNGMMDKYRSGEEITPEDSARWAGIDDANTQRMREIIAAHGWPGISTVGEEGAESVWLLVQHADRQPDFQKQCLALMEQAVAEGEASAKYLAYLRDRVRVNHDQPQIYGTQCYTVDGELVPQEIEDPDHVDERRAEVGLGSLAEYLAMMRR